MKRFMAPFLLSLFVLVIPATASAKSHHHSKIDPTFVCSAGTCTYTVTGLAPSIQQGTCDTTCYSTRVEFTPTDPNNGVTGFGSGRGCNSGYGYQPTDANGTISVVLDEDFLECIGVGTPQPGTVTAWLTNDSDSWDAPVVAGTLVSVSVP